MRGRLCGGIEKASRMVVAKYETSSSASFESKNEQVHVALLFSFDICMKTMST